MLQQSEMLFFIKLKLIWRSWDGGGGPYVFHYRADILRKSRGVVHSDWFGKVVGVFYKLYFAAGFTRGKYLIPVEWFGKPDGGFPR